MIHSSPALRVLIASLTLAEPVSLASLATQQRQSHRPPALDLSGMDPSVKPGDSFFRYANGAWLRDADVPADRSSWSAGAILAEATDRRTADLIREVATADARLDRRDQGPHRPRPFPRLHAPRRH
jgi:predicted metalloendopeptidase